MLRHIVGGGLVMLFAAATAGAASSPMADAAMKQNREAVRSLLRQKADVNAPQNDGTTALLWAVRYDDLDTADALIRAGANVSAANRDGATPLQLAALNGSAAMIEKLIKAGADPNAPLTPTRRHRADDGRAHRQDRRDQRAARKRRQRQREGILGRHDAADVGGLRAPSGGGKMLHRARRRRPRAVEFRRRRQRPRLRRPDADGAERKQKVEEFASGWLTPLMFAAREGDLASARLLVAAGADVNAIAGDGKDALGLAIFNGNYDLASFLVDSKSNVNKADTQGFTPLFWAVDRRNMETAPNFPWMVTADPLPLIRKLLDAGANPNALVNNTPRARMRAGSPRIVFATALMRAAFSGDLEL